MTQPVPSRGGERGTGPSSPSVHGEPVRVQLEKILASEAFSHSERLRRFLRFTVEEALRGHGDGLKEYQIGVEVFDRKDSYDTRLDPIVRVEAGRLRSKLKEFYETEGRDDRVLIYLQKGSYVPVFQERQPSRPMAKQVRTWPRALRDRKTIALLATTLVAVVALYWGVISSRENISLRREIEQAQPPVLSKEFAPIWGRFFAPDSTNFVVFGSPLFFASERGNLFLRWADLNEPASSTTDPRFQLMGKQFGRLTGPRYDYALMGDARALQRLTEFFAAAAATVTALPAYEATWDAIKGGNIIFLGAPRMIPLLERLPVKQDFEWDADHNVINRNPRPGEESKYVTPSHWEEMSYAILGCFPGLRPKREILLLTAHSAPGIIAAVDYLTQPETVRALGQRLGLAGSAEHKHFQLLLRVVVDKGNEVKSGYVTHHLVATAAVGP